MTIIGGDPWADDPDLEMARLQALREQLGIHDFVTFLGAKDQNELPYLLRRRGNGGHALAL